MANNKQEDLARRVRDNVLAALLEKEREVEEELDNIRHIESKLSHLRDDDTLERFREARLQKLKETNAKRMQYMNDGYCKLIDVDSDSQFFDVCRNTKYVVAHFYRPTTVRSQYLDGKMHELCLTYFNTKFIRVNVEKTPFLCERFNIWCLPTTNSSRVYVGNLSWKVKWQDLKDHMKQVGEVIRADIIEDYDGKSKGCGIVEFVDEESAQRAMEELNDSILFDRPIFVREDRESSQNFRNMRRGGVHREWQPNRSGKNFGDDAGVCVVVTNLQWKTSWQDLKDLFKTCAPVTRYAVSVNKVVHRGVDSALSSSRKESSPRGFDIADKLKLVNINKSPTLSSVSGSVSISGSSETASASYLLAPREINRHVHIQTVGSNMPIRRGYSDDVHNMLKKRGNRLFKTHSHHSPRKTSNGSDYGHVYLNIYDLEAVNRVVNVVAGTFGAGAYHAGVEIYGHEYNFGYTPQGVSGIVQSQPRYHAAHKYRKSIDLGKTKYSPREVSEIIEMMKPLWLGTSYDILKKNCLNFADAFCKKLGVGGIPSWVMGLQNKINWTRDSIQSGAAKLKQIDEAVGISRAFGSLSRKLTGECAGGNN
ncbi:single stranded G-strand telomeric DNA-binding [Babesia ovis]|uniref:Single stranded G-strand telomeric DNA-binding n=1 Tax=Babesia ovis TaxID=5869 RepID=A0A9W5WUF9_BABOV|nr:single stranded G-strand telomeric DNA-binding [Babesia ovis]